MKMEFHPTGKGYVLCIRVRPEGVELPEIRYHRTDPKPDKRFLSKRQWDELNAAWELEFGVAP